jgi:signal transduction histidine kinase
MALDTWRGHRATLDNLLEGFQIIAFDWTYLYVNTVAAKHGRRSADELHGRKMWDAYPGFDRTPTFEVLQRCMVEREAAATEVLFTFPDNTSRWFEIRVEPVPDGICIHSVDIQRRKEAEVALREQESVMALGRMSAMVAHEIKNPLAGLSGALQVLRRRRDADDPEGQLLDQMLACLHTLDRLVQDLLVLAKPIDIHAQPVPIREIIEQALMFLDREPRPAGHRVRMQEDPPALVVRGDRELLTGVFRNLFLNAAEAMTEPGSIDVRLSRGGPSCHVTITDSGTGVPAELASRIFEPFVTAKKGGTGLGLAISRRVLRLHGGDLELLPDTPGATFRATIPLHSTSNLGTAA